MKLLQISRFPQPRRYCGETVAASSRQVTDERIVALPQFVTGGGWLSFLGLVNASALPQEVR